VDNVDEIGVSKIRQNTHVFFYSASCSTPPSLQLQSRARPDFSSSSSYWLAIRRASYRNPSVFADPTYNLKRSLNASSWRDET